MQKFSRSVVNGTVFCPMPLLFTCNISSFSLTPFRLELPLYIDGSNQTGNRGVLFLRVFLVAPPERHETTTTL